MADVPLKFLDIFFNGKLRNDVNSIYLSYEDFQTLKNYRYKNLGIKGVGGMSKINSSATAYTQIDGGFFFKKDQPSETHTILQTTSGTNSRLVKHTTAPPSAGNFTAWQTLDTNAYVNFSKAPDGSMVAYNGTKNYIYAGEEARCAKFIVFDPAGTFQYDYTDQVSNTANDEENTATMYTVPTTIDTGTKLLLHLDNNVTDSSATARTITNTDVTFDAADKVFGTHSAVFNGTTAKLTAPNHVDFSMSGGVWSIDMRIKPSSLAAVNPLFYMSTPIHSIAFTGGGNEPYVGGTIVGFDSGATGVVASVTVSSGSWAGWDAAGTIYYYKDTGSFSASEWLLIDIYWSCITNGAVGSTGTSYTKLTIETDGSLKFVIYDAITAANLVTLTSPASTISAGSWYYIEVVENGDGYYLYSGIAGGSTTRHSAVGTTARGLFYETVFNIGTDGSLFYAGKIDELRYSKAARHTSASYSVPVSAYGNYNVCSVYVGALRPIKGIKFYMTTPNNTESEVAVYYWDGTTWASVSNLVDGTSSGGRSLGTTTSGTISFDSTDSVAKCRYLNGNVAYFYQLVFTGMNSNTKVYNVTLNYPLQEVRDLWDGVFANVDSFYKYTTSYSDLITNVLEEDYVALDTTTFADISSMTSSHYLYAGFGKRMMGIRIKIPDTAYKNTNSSIINVSYWNGTAWTACTVSDSTSTGGVTLNHTGTISWDVIDENHEFMTSCADSNEQLYFYRIGFSATLSASVRIDIVNGIPSPKDIKPFKFAVFWQNRLWNCNDQTKNKNVAWPTAYNSVAVFSGDDSVPQYIGDSEELVAGNTLFSRYAGDLYDNMILLKKSSTYLIDGTTPDDWKAYTISDSIGCVAPKTLVKCDLSYEMGQSGITKHVLMWRSARGIECFDGQALSTVSNDIEDFFKVDSVNYVNTSMTPYEKAFFDEVNGEYHWLFATGSSTTLNKEYAYDLIKKKWFEVCRTQTEPTAMGTKRLNCGFSVEDSSGMKYSYGGTSDGYCERLENGTTMDGEGIKYVFRTGDAPLDKNLSNRTNLRHVKYTMVSKNTDATNGIIKVYTDGASSPLAEHTFSDVSQANSTHAFTTWKKGVNSKAVTHSIYNEITTSTETIGSEPIALTLLFKTDTEDV